MISCSWWLQRGKLGFQPFQLCPLIFDDCGADALFLIRARFPSESVAVHFHFLDAVIFQYGYKLLNISNGGLKFGCV